MAEGNRLVLDANKALGKSRVKIEVRGAGEWLYLRGTMPPKTGVGDWHQQRIALGMQCSKESVKQAIALAQVVSGDLNLGRFDWRKWDESIEAGDTCGYWIAKAEELWWAKRDRLNSSHQYTWRVGYASTFRTLPPDAVLSEDVLRRWILENSAPGKRRRGHYCTAARLLCKAAGINNAWIEDLFSTVELRPINPRSLPSDEEIEALRLQLPYEWRWIFGMMAAYGLRNHEVFGVSTDRFPIIRVRDSSKTGDRPVPPLHPRWAEEWQLQNVWIPPLLRWDEDTPNHKLGKKVTKGLRGIVQPYNLRHSYARRCVEYKITPDVAARYMGHSAHVHATTYRAWIGEEVYLNEWRKATADAAPPHVE